MTLFITLGDIFGLIFGAIVFLIILIVWCIDAWKKRRCKHIDYFENRSCHGICRECGADLGFIGDLRKTKAQTP